MTKVKIGPKAIIAAKITAAVLVAVLSFFVIAKPAASVKEHAETIQALDDNKITVMELAAASTAASTALSMLPNDVATPIANELAELSVYFLIIVCAIYLEKFLVTLTGAAAFKVIIPIACVIYIVYVTSKKQHLKLLAGKLIVFALAIFLVIPTSVQISDMIKETYDVSVDTTISVAMETVESIESSTEEEKGFIANILSGIKDGVNKATQKVTTTVSNIEGMLNSFIEQVALLLVTACLIPVLVLLFFVWIIKIVFGINISVPKKNIASNE